jgi:hypothetical protein
MIFFLDVFREPRAILLRNTKKGKKRKGTEKGGSCVQPSTIEFVSKKICKIQYLLD